MVVRPSSETTPFAACASPATAASCAGLWARTTKSARSARAAVESSASPPSSAASAAARPEPEAVASTGWPHPRASAAAMLPAPISATFIRAHGTERGSGLVEEALLDQPRALLGRHFDVARREQEDLLGDLLHAAVERVGETRGEVDEALGEVAVDALEVDDDRDLVLELVGDVLGVVERLRDHEVHARALAAAAVGASPAPAAARAGLDRAQPRGAPLGRRVVGEDVVDLVAAAAGGEAADVGPLAIALLEVALGLAGVVLRLLVRLAVLGEAEVDERAVHGVA